VLLLGIDLESRVPLHRQIVNGVREVVDTGALDVGERRSSTRRLAETLDVHRSTVANAYRQLRSLGFIETRPGARSRVLKRRRLVAVPSTLSRIEWDRISAPEAEALLGPDRAISRSRHGVSDTGVIPFASLDVDLRLLPLQSFRAYLRRAVRRQGAHLIGYGDPAGYHPLRRWISHRLHQHGIIAAEDEILLTSGSQQAIDLFLRLLSEPGRPAVVESPTYDHAIPLFRLHGFRPISVPIRSDGMDLDTLETILDRDRPALVHTIPSFQNPSGVCTSQAHRERLLRLCEARRVPLLEDGYEEEMQYSDRIVLPIKSIDQHSIVVYCGTFSETLFAGLRIGWVVAVRECIERLTALRRSAEIAPSMILHAAMCEFCRDGSYDRHVRRMHRTFRRRTELALCALREEIPRDWADWTEPMGGFVILMTLRPAPKGFGELNRRFAAGGGRVARGRPFFPAEPVRDSIRLSISALDDEEIVEGIRRLRHALAGIYEVRSPG